MKTKFGILVLAVVLISTAIFVVADGTIRTNNGDIILDPASGKVGIGTTSPIHPLHVVSHIMATDELISNESGHGVRLHPWGWGVNIEPLVANDDIYFGRDEDIDEIYFETGDIKILTGSIRAPSVYGDVVGGTNRDLYIDNEGDIGYVSSSIDLKENVRNASDTDWIYDLRVVDFDYKDRSMGQDQVGMIAEEVELVEPRLVSYKRDLTYDCGTNETRCDPTITTTDEPETVNYGSPILISSVIKELQDLKQEQEILQEEIAFLRSMCRCESV